MFPTIPQQSALLNYATERAFLILPERLLFALREEFDEKALASDLFEAEEAMLTANGGHTENAGFWRGVRISYNLLGFKSLTSIEYLLDDATLKAWEWTLAQARANLKKADERMEFQFKVAQGFAGWLLTTPIFLAEQSTLLREFANTIQSCGIPRLESPMRGKPSKEQTTQPTKTLDDCCTKFRAFCLRWRLSGLAAPNLPIPLRPLTPVPEAIFALGPQNDVGALFYMPDTFPVPSRDELRGMIEESLRNGGLPEHLTEWGKIVRAGNQGKNKILKFGRLFELQHYCRILEERHASMIQRRQAKLERALGVFLGVSPESIHRDLLLIRKRLGSDWMQRGNNSELYGSTDDEAPRCQ